MNIIIEGINFKLTPALRQYVEAKLRTLEKLWSGSGGRQGVSEAEVRVELARTTHHHRHGNVFRAALSANFIGSPEKFYAEALEDDVRVAFDEAKAELERQIKKMKGKREAVFLRGARTAKKFLKISNLARWFRRGRIRDEGL